MGIRINNSGLSRETRIRAGVLIGIGAIGVALLAMIIATCLALLTPYVKRGPRYRWVELECRDVEAGTARRRNNNARPIPQTRPQVPPRVPPQVPPEVPSPAPPPVTLRNPRRHPVYLGPPPPYRLGD